MNCEETQELVHAYIDRELDLVRSLEVERHVDQCRSCSESCARLRALRSSLSSAYRLPPRHLEKRIVSDLRKAAKNESRRPLVIRWRWIGVPAAVAVVIVASLAVVRFWSAASPDELLAREAVASHVRSLMADHLADVASSDQHTVKPWFNGKLDFSPPVIDLAEQGFPLTGGRLDYLDNRAVAALVYQRRAHVINLFIWPSQARSNSPERTGALQGYNLIRWRQSDMNWLAASDLNASELTQFVNLIKGKNAAYAQ